MKITKPGGGTEPLRTFAEMAEEFGITSQRLSIEMRDSKIPYPKPARKCHATRTGPARSYYKPSEMHRWWKAHQASKSCPKLTSDS